MIASGLAHHVPVDRHAQPIVDPSEICPRLPAELTDRVIFFCTDRTTLLQCALVCKDFIAMSRTTAFRNPVCVVRPEDDVLITSKLTRLLESPRSTLRHYLLRMMFVLTIPRRYYESSTVITSASMIMASILRMRISLVEIELKCDPYDRLPQGFFDVMISSRMSLRRIHIRGLCTMLDRFMRIVGSCHALEDLGLSLCRAPTAQVNKFRPPSSLSSVSLSTLQPQFYREWLAEFPVQPQRLVLDVRDGPVWSSYLSRSDVAQNLSHLTLCAELEKEDGEYSVSLFTPVFAFSWL